MVEVARGGALVQLEQPVGVGGRELRSFLLVPRERGWGLSALWFAFIAVDAFPAHGEAEEPLGHWWMRLGGKR